MQLRSLTSLVQTSAEENLEMLQAASAIHAHPEGAPAPTPITRKELVNALCDARVLELVASILEERLRR